MLSCTDCRTEDECQRYHDDLMSFLDEENTKKEVGKKGIAAVRSLARKLHTDRAKVSGHRRMFLKDVVSAMTTSPVEGQIGETRKTGANRCIHMHDSIGLVMGRVERNLEDRLSAAHRELASVNMSSCSPTNAFLIRRGEALVGRCYEERLPLKSAQTTHDTWITWDNSAVDRSDARGTLFDRITKMMRVSTLRLYRDEDGLWFVLCDCGGKENLGVPCGCFYRIAETAGVPKEEIVDLVMISPRYLKCWQTHYGTPSTLGTLLYEAQAQAFADKRKGIRVPDKVARRLLHPVNAPDHAFPHFGRDTNPSHYKEAQFILKRKCCTRSDLVQFRSEKKLSGPRSRPLRRSDSATRSALAVPLGLGDTLVDSDMQIFGARSAGADRLHKNLENSLLATPVRRPDGQVSTKKQQELYSDILKKFEEKKASVLRNSNY